MFSEGTFVLPSRMSSNVAAKNISKLALSGILKGEFLKLQTASSPASHPTASSECPSDVFCPLITLQIAR
jgi:hypothetical protein